MCCSQSIHSIAAHYENATPEIAVYGKKIEMEIIVNYLANVIQKLTMFVT